MKETSANVNTENESRKFYLSEFSYDDGEYEITFNILDVSFVYETICKVYEQYMPNGRNGRKRYTIDRSKRFQSLARRRVLGRRFTRDRHKHYGQGSIISSNANSQISFVMACARCDFLISKQRV